MRIGHPHPLVVTYKGIGPDSELLDWIKERLVGGVVLFRENCPNDDHIKSVTRRLREIAGDNMDFRIMIDEEGGTVRRLSDSDVSMPDLREYGSLDDGTKKVAEAYFHVAERLDDLDIDTLLAPVADIASDDDPSGEWLSRRVFSDDPVVTAEMVERVTQAVQSLGIHACAKHFPGLGGAVVDPHEDTTSIDVTLDDWIQGPAIPFAAATKAKTDCIMVGHQLMTHVDRHRPAVFSAPVIRGLLRDRLGYEGEVLSDDLAMGAVSNHYPIERAVNAALEAGCDRLLICQNRRLQRRAVSTLANYAHPERTPQH